MLLLRLTVEDVALPLLAGSAVPSAVNVLLVDTLLELEPELLELRVVPPVLNSGLVLDDRDFEPPVL